MPTLDEKIELLTQRMNNLEDNTTLEDVRDELNTIKLSLNALTKKVEELDGIYEDYRQDTV